MKIQLLKKLAPLLLAAGPYGVIIVAVKRYSHNPLAARDLTKKNEDLPKSDEGKKVNNSETKVDEIDPIKQPGTSAKPTLATRQAELEDAKSTVETAKTALQQQLSTIKTELATSKTDVGVSSTKVTQLEEKIQAIQTQLDNKTDEDKSVTVLTDKKHLLIKAYWAVSNKLSRLFNDVIKHANYCRVQTSDGWTWDYTPSIGKIKDRMYVYLGSHINLETWDSRNNFVRWRSDSSYELWDTKPGPSTMSWSTVGGVRRVVGAHVDFGWSPYIESVHRNFTVGTAGYTWSYIGVKLTFAKGAWIAIGCDNTDTYDSSGNKIWNARAELIEHANQLKLLLTAKKNLLTQYQSAVLLHNKTYGRSIPFPKETYNDTKGGTEFAWSTSR